MSKIQKRRGVELTKVVEGILKLVNQADEIGVHGRRE